jgi:PAS domain-containing protein
MPNVSGIKTPIEQGMIARLVQGVRYGLTGKMPQDWFGPNQPLVPQAPQAVGRQYDYRTGINLDTRPRSDEPIKFSDMRALADSYDLLRLIIETRKDQIAAMDWSIKPKDEDAEAGDDVKKIQDFFAYPDQEHTWDAWLRMLAEDLFVIDAPTIYPRMTRGGDVYAFELVDGATIKRVVDYTGRTPLPPDPAYQQILKGLPAVDYSRDELIYMPRNPRTHKLYGYSPVEQIIMTINIALRRQVHQLQFYTEGNIPEALISVPESWNPDQIAQFQNYWDSLLEGDTAARRHAKFVPNGTNPIFTKEGTLKDEYDEWIARIVCFAFSVNPTPFIKQQNRATADNAQSQAIQEGLLPQMKWVKGVMDLILAKWWKRPDLQFTWGEEAELNALDQAKVDQIYVTAKVKHPDEVRGDLGLDPLTPEQKEEMNPVPVVGEDGENPAAPGKPGAPSAKKAPPQDADKVAKKKLYTRPRRLIETAQS